MKISRLNWLIAMSVLGTACETRSVETFTVDGKTYSVPSSHLSSSSREPHLFVRIKHPDKPYDLVYDGRAPGAQLGPGVPRLFSINDEDQSGVEYSDLPDGMLVCRKAVHPKGGCGLRFRHLDVEWILLFPIARAGEANSFKRDAAALLDDYAA